MRKGEDSESGECGEDKRWNQKYGPECEAETRWKSVGTGFEGNAGRVGFSNQCPLRCLHADRRRGQVACFQVIIGEFVAFVAAKAHITLRRRVGDLVESSYVSCQWCDVDMC